MASNPKGSALLVAEQLPNSAAALGSGWAGAKAGSMAGGTLGGLPGAAIGGVTGFVTGMFGANYALEGGNKAIEAAANGPLSEADKQRVVGEGAAKAGVITGVDAITLGIGGKVAGVAQRAVDRAGARVLTEAGVDATDRAAVLAAVRQNPALIGAVKEAEEAAFKASTTLGQRAIQGGTGLALETFGEGLGEYAGEGVATGNWDKMEAMIEAFSSLGQSGVETGYNIAKNNEQFENLSRAASMQKTMDSIAQAQQAQAAAQQAIATAPTIDAAVDAFKVANAAGSASMVDQSQLLNDVNEATNASIADLDGKKSSVVFGGEIGLQPVSSQKSSDGVNSNAERFGNSGNSSTVVNHSFNNVDAQSGISGNARESFGENSVPFEKARNSVRMDVEFARDLMSSHPSVNKGLDFINAEQFGVVERLMLFGAKNSKIRDSVIKSIPVDVMNMLARKKISPETLFNNPSVFKDVFSSSKLDNSVPLVVNPAVGMIRKLADVIAKEISADASSDLVFMPEDVVSASGALNGNHINKPVNKNSIYTPETESKNSEATKFAVKASGGVEPTKAATPKKIKPLSKWTEQEARDRLERGDLSDDSRQKIEAHLQSKIAIREEAEAAEAAKKERIKQMQEAKKANEGTFLVGQSREDAERVSVRDGVVYLGDYPAENFETGDDVTVKEGATKNEILRSLVEAGAVSDKALVFGRGNSVEKASNVTKGDLGIKFSKSSEPPAKNVTVDQVDIFNEQGGLRFSKDEEKSNRQFVTAPDGSIDFGEITQTQSGVMRRQPGKIRLTIGIHKSDGTGHGLVHIEANHGKQIRNAGFDSVEEFVFHVASNFDQIWGVPGVQLLATVRDGKQHMMYVELEQAVDKDGEYYRVNSAFPVRQEDYPERHGFSKLWDGSEPTSTVTGEQSAFAGQSESGSGQTTPNARGQSNSNIRSADNIRKSFAGQSTTPTPLPQQTAERLIVRELGSTTLAKVLVDSGIVSFANSEAELKKLGGKLMVAWHGSPHDHDGFTTAKIGTGEGAQAYGWGLYFASSKGVAEWYKSNLSYKQIVKDFRDALPDDADFSDIIDLFDTGHFTPYQERVLKALSNDDWLGYDYPSQAITAAYRSIDDFDASKELKDAINSSGKLYQVELAPSEDEYLDWDKPLSKQSKKVKKLLAKVFGKYDTVKVGSMDTFWDADEVLGAGMYREITGRFEKEARQRVRDGEYISDTNAWAKERASKLLNEIGIRGIRYLDGTSRGAGEGSSNYVIFSDEDVSITAKYAKEQQILGATLPDGRIILNLGALTEQNFAGVFKHEGFHSTVRELVGEETWNQLMSQLEQNLKLAKGNDWVTRANAAIPADTKASDRTEELAAYAIEQTTNGAKVPNFIKRWVDSLLSAIRTALIRGMGGEKAKLWAMKNLKPQDLANLAVAGLKAKARNELASQGRAAMAYSAKDLDGGNNGKGRGFWDVLRARGEGFRGVYPGSTVQALSVRGRVRKAVGVIGRYRGDDASTIIRWNDSLAGFDGYYSVGVKYKNAFATYFIPANRFTSPEDALLNDDFLRENAFFSIGFSFKQDGYELHVSDPVNGSSIFNEMLADGRLKPTEDYSSDGSHHYHAVQFDDKRDLPMLMSEAVRRLAIHIGKAPERVYSDGRDTGVNKERPRDYNADQVEAKFSTAFGPESQHRTPLGDITEIEVDGVKRPALNSNGKPIHWSREGVENFWRWFSDSRVVDAEGRPLVVYHGTTADFSEFDLGFSGSDGVGYDVPAIFATTDKNLANDYSLNKFNREIADAMRAMQRFKNENPGVYGDEYERLYQAVKDAFAKQRNEGRPELGGGANVVPLYMRGDMAEVDANGQRFMAVMPKALPDAMAQGKDGVIVNDVIDNASPATDYPARVFVTFKPENVKSATGNRGTFDGENPDIRFSRATAQPTPLPEETKAQAAQRKVQDKFNRFTVIKDFLKEHGVTLSEQADVYKAEERMHSRFANKVEDFRTKLVEPLIKKIQAAGFSMDDVSLFLHAQHAEERNNQIAKINPKVTDGSGMSTADANNVLAAAPAELKALANEFRQITDMTKQTLLDAGIISRDMVDAWEGAYSNYVPLKGGPDEKAKSGTGKGLHVNGKMRRALGHGQRKGGEWIAENILADYERAVMLAEKNRVGHHLVRMALEAGRDDLITLNKPEKRAVLKNNYAFEVRKNGVVVGAFDSYEAANMAKMLHGSTGVTITQTSDPSVKYVSSLMLQDNEANVYVNGHAIRVQINDELLARAYKNLGAEALWMGMEAGRMLNGYLSKAYTGYNPEFILTNIVRDFTTGLINITGEEGALFAAKAAKNYVSSFGSLLKYAVSGKETQWIKDYRDDGGNTGAAYLSDLERLGKEIKTEYDSYKGVIENLKARDGAGAARAAGRNLFNVSLKWIEHLNQAGENAMRLSIYRAAIESGKTRAEAASLAKNSTVNFNRKGELGANINALYLFFNAGVQGTSALAHAHFKGKHKYQAWALSSGMIGLGFLAAAAFGGGDEDDYDRELSDYDKSRNLVIRAGDSWVKIPVPYGYGFFYNLGRHLADAERKGEWNKMPWHLASDFVGEFTPFSGVVAGKEPDMKQAIFALPTVAQIPGALMVNRTGMGSPIFPENKFDENQPDNLKMWRNTKGTIADDLAQVLDKAGLEVSPETLKYLGRTATGGSGAFVGSVFDAGKLTLEGADLETKEMPFVRKFVKEGSVSDYRAAFYEAKSEASKAADDLARAKKMGDMMSAKKLMEDNGELIAMDKYADRLSKMIKAKRDMQDVVKQDEKLTVAEKRLKLKALELEEQKVYDRYLDTFKQRTKERRERLAAVN